MAAVTQPIVSSCQNDKTTSTTKTPDKGVSVAASSNLQPKTQITVIKNVL